MKPSQSEVIDLAWRLYCDATKGVFSAKDFWLELTFHEKATFYNKALASLANPPERGLESRTNVMGQMVERPDESFSDRLARESKEAVDRRTPEEIDTYQGGSRESDVPPAPTPEPDAAGEFIRLDEDEAQLMVTALNTLRIHSTGTPDWFAKIGRLWARLRDEIAPTPEPDAPTVPSDAPEPEQNMTVRRLRNVLDGLPDDLPVVLQGTEWDLPCSHATVRPWHPSTESGRRDGEDRDVLFLKLPF